VLITLVKAAPPGVGDRVYLERDGDAWRGPVHVVHDLPHLVVESLFSIEDGLWAELAARVHADAERAVTARDPKRQKKGRIVSGAASAARTDQWLTAGHRRAKLITNCVANRSGDGPDTPAGVRARVARADDPAAAELVGRLDDATIDAAITGARELARQWHDLPPGAVLRLSWPLPPDMFKG
jgi:hypothetical protein